MARFQVSISNETKTARARGAGRTRARALIPYLWVLPALALYTVFKLVPLVGG